MAISVSKNGELVEVADVINFQASTSPTTTLTTSTTTTSTTSTTVLSTTTTSSITTTPPSTICCPERLCSLTRIAELNLYDPERGAELFVKKCFNWKPYEGDCICGYCYYFFLNDPGICAHVYSDNKTEPGMRPQYGKDYYYRLYDNTCQGRTLP